MHAAATLLKLAFQSTMPLPSCRSSPGPAPPALQANVHDISRKLQRNTLKENGASMAVTASALGSKDSLYTIQDAPAAPTTRIPAAQVGRLQLSCDNMGIWDLSGGAVAAGRSRLAARVRRHSAHHNPTLDVPLSPSLQPAYDRYGEQAYSRNAAVPAW